MILITYNYSISLGLKINWKGNILGKMVIFIAIVFMGFKNQQRSVRGADIEITPFWP